MYAATPRAETSEGGDLEGRGAVEQTAWLNLPHIVCHESPSQTLRHLRKTEWPGSPPPNLIRGHCQSWGQTLSASYKSWPSCKGRARGVMPFQELSVEYYEKWIKWREH